MIFTFGDHRLDLGENPFGTERAFAMKDDSSYLEKFIKRYKSSGAYRDKLLPIKLQCLENLRESLAPYATYLDLLAGLGMSGRIFATDGMTLNDRCPYCFEILKKNFPDARVENADMFTYNPPRADLIFGDFNNGTLKRFTGVYKAVLDLLFAKAGRYLILNDCSVFYLKYGRTAYENYSRLMGEELEGTRDDFYRKVRRFYRRLYPTFSLTRIEAFSDTSFLLFERGDFGHFETKVNGKDDIKISTALC